MSDAARPIENIRPAPPSMDLALWGRLHALGARLRAYLLLQGLARLAAFVLLAAFLQFGLDYGVRGMRWSIRAALLAVLVLFALFVLWRRVLSVLAMRIDPADTAKLVERRFPQLRSLLISAVRFATGEVGSPETNSPPLMERVVRKAPLEAGSLDFSKVFSSRAPRRSGLVLAGVLLVVLLAALGAPQVTRLWFARNVLLRETPWPKRTHLIVDLPAGELVGARGDDLTLTARAEGVIPEEVEVRYTTASGQQGRETMSAVGRDQNIQFRYIFKNAREEFTFYLTGGDDTTLEYRVRLLERPRIEWTEMTIVPPAYTQLEPFTVGGGERSAQVLPGSGVSIRIKTNKPIASALLMAADQQIATARPHDQGGFVARFVSGPTATYHFALRDEVGLEDKNPGRFSLRQLKDDPPQARLRAPGLGEMITPEAEIPLELESADTYGLATTDLRYVITRDGTPQSGAIELSAFKPRMTTFSDSLIWPVSAAAVLPGDRISLRVSASDFDDVSGPKTTESSELTVRVVTADELLAELSRREHEFRMDFERLIDAQEQLRGRLLSLMDVGEGGSTDFAAAVSNLERRQRGIAGSVNVVRQQFEHVLVEMRISKLASPPVEDRLGGKIVTPLTEMARRDLPMAGDAIRAWGRSGAREAAREIDAQQVALLARMRGILAHMIQWQGYQEAVNMLRDILRLQEELKKETRERLKEAGKDVFDQ